LFLSDPSLFLSEPNHSKGDIVFMGVFANVYIGNKFSGTLEIKSNITGKKESYKITGFSRILTPKSKADKDKTDKNKDVVFVGAVFVFVRSIFVFVGAVFVFVGAVFVFVGAVM
jgi:hypothetical protein